MVCEDGVNSRVRNEDELGAVQFQALKNGL